MMHHSPIIVADRHFCGPAHTAPIAPAPTAAPILHPRKSPPFATVKLHHRAQWKRLWRQLNARRHLRLLGAHSFRCHTPLTLVFETPDAIPALALGTTIVQSDSEGFIAAAPPPSLSWRLAAVRLARTLPITADDTEPAPGSQILSPRPLPRDRPLCLRWDLPGPASLIVESQPFTQLITALRAGFPSLRQLQHQTSLPETTLTEFLLSLYHAGLLRHAPILLQPTPNPFEFLGLHWSAYDALIRRRYQLIVNALRRRPDAPKSNARLEAAFELLCQPELRRALRRAILSPPLVSEVSTFYRLCLDDAQRDRHADRAIDLCRRILELNPNDAQTRRTLTRHLCGATTRSCRP